MEQIPFDEFDQPQEQPKPRRKLTLEDFEKAYPEIAAWWKDTHFDFALSLRDYVQKNGRLTERQMAAAHNCIQKVNDIIAAKKAAEENAKKVDIGHIEEAFQKGQSNGILRPKLRLLNGDDYFLFSLAPLNGNNAGAIYVSCDGTYLGKIKDSKFYRSRECDDRTEAEVIEVCDNPEQAAIAYGQRFGSCSCCGRTLTNALSIELGIGPICRGNFFG